MFNGFPYSTLKGGRAFLGDPGEGYGRKRIRDKDMEAPGSP